MAAGEENKLLIKQANLRYTESGIDKIVVIFMCINYNKIEGHRRPYHHPDLALVFLFNIRRDSLRS